MVRDYYRVLGLHPGASLDEVRAAYRRQAKQHRPDAGGDSEKFRSLKKAYETLSNPASRRRYDRQRVKFRQPSRAAKSLVAEEPQRLPRATPPNVRRALELDDADRLFREFDEFFERLEAEFVAPPWGRSE